MRLGYGSRIVLVALLGSLGLPSAAVAEDGGRGPGGPSTPSSLVVAVNPARPSGTLQITLAAHTSKDATPSASMVLRVDDLEVAEFDVHRVAVGDTSCSGHDGAVATDDEPHGVRAVVRGVGVLTSGTASLPEGSAVQVWVDLEDGGQGPDVDRGRVRIRPAPHAGEVTVSAHDDGCAGGDGGWTVDTRWQPVLQVRTRQPRG